MRVLACPQTVTAEKRRLWPSMVGSNQPFHGQMQLPGMMEHPERWTSVTGEQSKVVTPRNGGKSVVAQDFTPGPAFVSFLWF